MHLQWIDWFIVGLVGLSALAGLLRGMVKEVVALLAWMVSLYVAYQQAHLLAPYFKEYIHDDSGCGIAAFITILLLGLLLGAIVNGLLGLILKSAGLSGMDKLLGSVFGFIRGIFIVSLLIAVVKLTAFPYEEHFKKSLLIPKLEKPVEIISSYIPVVLDKMKAADKGQVSSMLEQAPLQEG